MNLIHDAWIPIITQSGIRKTIRPVEILDTTDIPERICSGRPDFDANLVVFLIGLFYSSFTPKRKFKRPSIEEANRRFERVAPAFELFGERPFMQDYRIVYDEKKAKPIRELLIGSPGANTLKENKDIFERGHRIDSLSIPMSILALFTLQSNAPSGGQGHRTSMRGGGPVTTLNWVGTNSLVDLVFANIPSHKDNEPNNDTIELSVLFPWMGEIPTSEKNEELYPDGCHSSWWFWGLPRRIRLYPATDGNCSLTGEHHVITQYMTKARGTNFASNRWQHPLTPYYRKKPNEPMLPFLTPKGGFSYPKWPQVTASTEIHSPARTLDTKYPRVWVFGFDMDNMKARNWFESITPNLPFLEDENHQDLLCYRTHSFVEASNIVASALNKCFGIATKKSSTPADVKAEYWDRTEADYHLAIRDLSIHISKDIPTAQIGENFLLKIRQSAFHIFDQRMVKPIDISKGKAPQIAKARLELRKKTNSKKIRNLLNIPEKK